MFKSTMFLPIMIAIIVIGTVVGRFLTVGPIVGVRLFQIAAFIILEVLAVLVSIRLFNKVAEAW